MEKEVLGGKHLMGTSSHFQTAYVLSGWHLWEERSQLWSFLSLKSHKMIIFVINNTWALFVPETMTIPDSLLVYIILTILWINIPVFMTKKLRELKQVIQDGALSRRAQCFITGKYQCCTLKNSTLGTSLAGQQLRIRLAMQGCRFDRLGN